MKQNENISLKPYNTFGIDVKARRLVLLEPGDEVPPLEGAVLLLGGGSNIVFTKDYDGTVITLSHSNNQTIKQSDNLVTAWGGVVMDDLVQWTLDHGLYGLENFSAIPGTVGASVVQNVGAYGAEAKDFIENVEAYDLVEHRLCSFSNEECRFAYRDSMFKHHPNRHLILRVTYRLHKEYTPNLSYKALDGLPHDTVQQLRDSITTLRWSKLPRPEEHGSAGSFFKNPVVDEATYRHLKAEYPDMPDAHQSSEGYKLSAGWLIDRAGWKGRTQGKAGVWPKNALVLYNAGGCTGDEVHALAAAIQDDVKHKFNITLAPEAIII
jgi:UDP-N-acetylmuramate dehydrogenase